jgi:hypothetical protein
MMVFNLQIDIGGASQAGPRACKPLAQLLELRNGRRNVPAAPGLMLMPRKL